MDDVDIAPLVGIVGCLGVLATLLYPYIVAEGGVGTYYGSGVINPLVGGMLALVTIIVLAAGRQNRTDPGLAAGAGIVFGLFVLLLTLGWGLTARVDAVVLTELHRWAVPGTAAFISLGSAWYARALGIV